MSDINTNIFQQIAERTGGDIYLGVVGPVRTGKSTFVKRVMETLVIPNIENIYQKERAIDELPQCGSGKTIMTSEPKFIPEDAVEISPDGTAVLRVRIIDSVGYVIPGALGAEEDGHPRMITTPWCTEEISMIEAAELGTKKIMDEHCTIGVVVTTDGSIHDIQRADYVDAEYRAIEDMKKTGKPYIVLINSVEPNSEKALTLQKKIEEEHKAVCLTVNCLTLTEEEIRNVLTKLLYAFPIGDMQFYLPGWISALPVATPLVTELYNAMIKGAQSISTLSQIDNMLSELRELSIIEHTEILSIDSGKGIVNCLITMPDALYYEKLSEASGFKINNDSDLLRILTELSEVKTSFDKISSALQQVSATGYGIVSPTIEEMTLEEPEIVKKGNNYGVKITARAPSIHMLRADIETEISPIVGDEKQSRELLDYLLQDYEEENDKLWQSNIFGKTVYELVNEGISSKLKRMPEEARIKLQTTLSRLINEDSSGLLCLIFA